MAQDNTVPNVANISPKVSLHETMIEGKIASIDQPQNSDYTYYTFNLPAKDQYSLPAVVQVSQSSKDRPFGRVGDLLRIKCAVSGFPRRSGGNTYITNVLTYLETH